MSLQIKQEIIGQERLYGGVSGAAIYRGCHKAEYRNLLRKESRVKIRYQRLNLNFTIPNAANLQADSADGWMGVCNDPQRETKVEYLNPPSF